jgi:hypothetical protein
MLNIDGSIAQGFSVLTIKPWSFAFIYEPEFQ